MKKPTAKQQIETLNEEIRQLNIKSYEEKRKLEAAIEKHNQLAVQFNNLLSKWNAILLVVRD